MRTTMINTMNDDTPYLRCSLGLLVLGEEGTKQAIPKEEQNRSLLHIYIYMLLLPTGS